MQNQENAARKSLQFFRGKNYPVEVELNEIQSHLDKFKMEKQSLIQSFSTKAAKMSLFISLGLMFIQQLSGVNAVIFYTGDIFKVILS